MKRSYDFSKGERGKFYSGDKAYDVVIHVDHAEAGATFEVFTGKDGKYHFRLSNPGAVLFTSEEGFATQDDCLAAISQIKQESLLAPTVFA
jgi:uncharacterized protein YegP (UPF0339 family)